MPSLSESIWCFDQCLQKRFKIDNYPTCAVLCDGWLREKLCQRMVQFSHWLWMGGGRISSSLEKVSWHNEKFWEERKEEEKGEANQFLWRPIKMGWWPIKMGGTTTNKWGKVRVRVVEAFALRLASLLKFSSSKGGKSQSKRNLIKLTWKIKLFHICKLRVWLSS